MKFSEVKNMLFSIILLTALLIPSTGSPVLSASCTIRWKNLSESVFPSRSFL